MQLPSNNIFSLSTPTPDLIFCISLLVDTKIEVLPSLEMKQIDLSLTIVIMPQ